MNKSKTTNGYEVTILDQLNVQWGNFIRYRFLLQNLVSRDFKVKYRRSVLGILWSILNPLLMMLVITAVFANIFRFEVEYFPVYYLTGILIFNFISEATNGSMLSILNNHNLIKKVYIPKYIFPLQKCIFAFINMLFSTIAVIAVILILGLTVRPTALLFWVPMIYALIFSIGLGLILSTLAVFFRDITHLYTVWITAWMFLTPIIYPIEQVPESVRLIIYFNPMFHFIDYLRNVVMHGTVPGMIENLICLAFAVGFLILGLAMFKWKQGRFILYI